MVQNVSDACKEQGVEAPIWRSDGGFVTITFMRPFVTNSDTEQREAPFKHRPSTDQVQKMILSMDDGYMTMSEFMVNIGLKHLPTFRENYFLPALAEEAIERLYPEQPNHPKQKYRLTEFAKEWKKNI